MPQISQAQLIELSRVPQTMFFIWHEGPASRYYHMMITPDGQCLSLHLDWTLHDSFTLGPVEISRRYMLHSYWVQVTREQFCAAVGGRDSVPSAPDSRLKTNHKLGAPKGKLP